MNKIYALLAAFLVAGSAFAAVNINTATKAELEALPDIGPARAQAIIDYRTKNGAFKSADDLKKVDGVGDKNFAEMKDKVSTSGPTKIDWKKEAIKSLDIEMNQHHPFYDANISVLKSKVLSEGCYERK